MKLSKINKIKSLSSILFIVPIIFVLAGCRADLERIEQFEANAEILEKAARAMADDIYNLCLSKFNTDLELGKIKISEVLDERKKCEERKEIAERIFTTNSILINYYKSIGRLANNKTVTFNENLSSLGISIKNLATNINSNLGESEEKKSEELVFKPSVEQQKIDAGVSIADFLIGLFFDNVRREALEKTIVCTEESIQSYTEGLFQIVELFYIGTILKTEENRINDLIQDSIDNDLESLNSEPIVEIEDLSPTSVVSLMRILQDYEEQYNRLDNRKNAGIAYVGVLRETAQLHSKIRNKFTSSLSECDRQISQNSTFQDVARKKIDESPRNSSLEKFKRKSLEQRETIEQMDKLLENYLKTIESPMMQIEKGFLYNVPEVTYSLENSH